MKRTLTLTAIVTTVFASSLTFAIAPLQRIDITNMLWNHNATDRAQGLTPTSVTLSFRNGGAKPCFTTNVAFQAGATVLSGTGQPCVAAITSISVTPIAGPAGAVYAAPEDIQINASYFVTQIILSNKNDPIFDSTHGGIKTQGAVQVTTQGQFQEALK